MQVVEHVFPQSDAVSAEDQRAISYLSFPDGNSQCMGDSVYTVRVPPTAARPHPLYAFVCFRQRPDAAERRGFFQKVFKCC